MKKKKLSKFFTSGYLILILLFIYLPIGYLILFSFNAGKSMTNFSGLSQRWYENLFSKETAMLESIWTTLIVAGISSATVVGEAYRHSGTLITVSLALGMGRDVLAVPYRADEDSACNLLIKEGAPAVETVEDVLSYIRK